MSATANVDLRLQGPMDHLRLAWQAGETLLADVPFTDDPDGVRYNILLSIQELLTNVLRHAYGGDESRPVVLRMEASGAGFAFELRDDGAPFDPTMHDTSGLDEGPPVEPGGYGIVIVKMVMDQLEYSYEEGWNVIRASKSVYSPVGVMEPADEQA